MSGASAAPIAATNGPSSRSLPASRSAASSPAMPGAGRGPRSSSSSSRRASARQISGARPHAASGCFSSASSGTGAKSCATASSMSRRKMPGGVRFKGSPAEIVDLDAPAPELGGDAAGEIAIGRDQRRGAARRLSVWRSRRAMTSASSCGPGQSIRLRPSIAAGDSGGRLRHRSLDAAGRSASNTQSAPRGRRAAACRRRKLLDLRGVKREAPQQARQQMLRVRRVLGDLPPGLVVAVARDAGQDDHPVRQRGDGGDEIGDRRQAAGDAGGDDRMRRRMMEPVIRLRPQHAVAPLGRVETADLGERKRPIFAHDIEECEHPLPMLGVLLRHERGEIVERARLPPAPRRGSAQARRRGAPLARARAARVPWRRPHSSTRRVSISRRRRSGTAGGMSRLSSPPPSSPSSDSSSASRSPTGRSRGSSSARPSLARRNASPSARTARRVGSRIMLRASAAGSPPVRARRPAARQSRNGASGGMVKMRATLSARPGAY